MTGILAAFAALFSWGLGDFFIQKTSRKIGIVNSLFWICFLGAVALAPFAMHDFSKIASDTSILKMLVLATAVIFFAALFNFEALKDGKISIIEPVASLELPFTVLFSVVFAAEILGVMDFVLIAIVFVGIMMVATSHKLQLHYHRRMFERGVAMAGIGSIGMAMANFLVGFSSRSVSPVTVVWFTHTGIAVICLVYIIMTGQAGSLVRSIKKHPFVILFQSVFDNAAWIFFGTAATLIPISIATAISESYIAFAALLGLLFNRERVKKHQLIGIVVVVVGVTILGYLFE